MPRLSQSASEVIASQEKDGYNHDDNGESGTDQVESDESEPFSAPKIVSMYPPLSTTHLQTLLAETVHVIMSIGGHENPPARHIIGREAVANVKEKLSAVSKELDDFVKTSSAVDIPYS